MINGIYFFAERIKNKSYGCDPLECKMQIFNIMRHLKKGTRRFDTKQLIFNENLQISQMSDEEISQYWFFKKLNLDNKNTMILMQ